MSDFDYDLVVIGAGSGGVRAARVAAGHGARVAICEEFRIGGTCVIRGCVPKKLYVMASRFHDDFEDAAGFGWRVGPVEFDWPTLVRAKEEEIGRLSGLYAQNLERSNVEIIRARGVIDGPNGVVFADKRRVSTRHILIATGAAPLMPPEIEGIEHAISSNEIFDLPDFPKRLLVVGGGYIAVEFASVFVRFGSAVHLAFRADLPLRGFDEDLRRHLQAGLVQAGVDVRAGLLPTKIEKTADGVAATMQDGSRLDVDAVLVATGRLPLTAGLGLETAGVAMKENGAIVVDAFSRTSVPSIHAVGDVTDRIALTPVAIREGHAFADTVFGGKPTAADHELVATAVFTTPEIGTIGCTEEQAKARGARVDVYETSFRPMRATLSKRAEKAFMKILVDGPSDRVLGVHILGPDAGEMVQLLAIALRLGARKQDFDATMAVHPTLAEELVTMRAPSRVLNG
jgi:glutathione reductase (NADPH)